MEQRFEEACSYGEIPGVVLLAESRSRKFEYSRTFGSRSVKEAPNPPLEASTLMRTASASKLITSVAVMQCIERNLIGLDDDVIAVVPELRDIQLLSGFDKDDKPILVAPKAKLTPRRLLSHSSGFAYDVLSPLLVKWRKQHNTPTQPSGPKLTDRFLYPLTSEPGTEWIYSPSVDWAGRLVEHLTGQKLEAYLATHVARPLGITTMTFYPQQHRDLLATHADMTARAPSGALEYSDENYWHEDPEDAFGGMALFAGARDFFAVLRSLLLDDGKLLSSAARAEFFSPQLSEHAQQSLMHFVGNKEYSDLGMGAFFPYGSRRDHALAGMLLLEDVPDETPRRKGTVAWIGQPNFYWFIDPTAGLCALFACQLKPSDDKPAQELVRLFEKTIYERMYEAEKEA